MFVEARYTSFSKREIQFYGPLRPYQSEEGTRHRLSSTFESGLKFSVADVSVDGFKFCLQSPKLISAYFYFTAFIVVVDNREHMVS